MRTVTTAIAFVAMALVNQQTLAQTYCNVNFQDRGSLTRNIPYSYYFGVGFPPGYSQACRKSNMRIPSVTYNHIHLSPEDPYWNCIGATTIGGVSTFAWGHDDGSGFCAAASDPNSIPRTATVHLCPAVMKFKRGDGKGFWPWELDVLGSTNVKVTMIGTNNVYYRWFLTPGYWGFTGLPSVYGKELQITGRNCSGAGPWTIDNMLTRYQ